MLSPKSRISGKAMPLPFCIGVPVVYVAGTCVMLTGNEVVAVRRFSGAPTSLWIASTPIVYSPAAR